MDEDYNFDEFDDDEYYEYDFDEFDDDEYYEYDDYDDYHAGDEEMWGYEGEY